MFVTSDILPKQIPWFGLTLNIVYFKTLAMIRVEEDERWMLFPVLVSSQNTVTSCGKRRDSVSFFQMHPTFSWFRDESLNKFQTSSNELLLFIYSAFPILFQAQLTWNSEKKSEPCFLPYCRCSVPHFIPSTRQHSLENFQLQERACPSLADTWLCEVVLQMFYSGYHRWQKTSGCFWWKLKKTLEFCIVRHRLFFFFLHHLFFSTQF